MDVNYDWNNPTFKDGAGASLNRATNALADVLHTLAVEAGSPGPSPDESAGKPFQLVIALRPVEAHVTAQTDEVLGSDLFNLLLRYIRPDPFELCFRSALSACAHGSPVTVSVDGACRGGSGRIGRLLIGYEENVVLRKLGNAAL